MTFILSSSRTMYPLIFMVTSLLYTTQCCEYATFNANIVRMKSTDNTIRSITINRCIEPTKELNDAIIIYVDQRPIPIIYTGAVVNLTELEVLFLDNNGIQRIQVGAFLNLPKLNKLDVSSNKLEEVEAGVFNDLPIAILNLHQNKISYIENGAFTSTQLRKLTLAHNELESFQAEWFGNSNLEAINLSDNRITYIPANAFKKFGRINSINLKRNRIKTVHKNAFAGIQKLDLLDLSYNQLKALHRDLFTSFGKSTNEITSLYIHSNNLTFLPEKLLGDIDRTRHMNLHSNPWECACYHKIMKWGGNKQVSFDSANYGCRLHTNPVCVTGLNDPTECVEVLNEENYSEYYKEFDAPDVTIKKRGQECSIEFLIDFGY